MMEVRKYISEQVCDWDDEVCVRARFKDFSGQRSDWEPIFLFWRDLILNIARHFRFLFFTPSQITNGWFSRGGLSPLCIDHVLVEMLKEGLIVPSQDLVDPSVTTHRFSLFYKKMRNLMASTTNTTISQHDDFVLIPVLKDEADRVVKLLLESHWTHNVVVTMSKFQEFCGGDRQHASAILSYLSAQCKARYLSLNKDGNSIQGVKVSLSDSPVSGISNLDGDVLHLIWTTQMLEQQLGVIDQRSDKSRKCALASLKSGNKNVALRHVRALKLANESREKCYTLLNRVEEVLNIIANAESTKKVAEAIQIGAKAIKENNLSLKEIEHNLQELGDSIDLQKQVESALDSTPSYTFVEDKDIEEEFKKLELEIGDGDGHWPVPKSEAPSESTENEASTELTYSLNDAFSNLKIVDVPSSSTISGQKIAEKKTKILELEPV